MKTLAIFYVAMICLAAPAMDRWPALSMIESGDEDNAVGRGGEVSRFQIRPDLWPGGDPRDAQHALAVAQEIMKPRLEEFEKNTDDRRPTLNFTCCGTGRGRLIIPGRWLRNGRSGFQTSLRAESNHA